MSMGNINRFPYFLLILPISKKYIVFFKSLTFFLSLRIYYMKTKP